MDSAGVTAPAAGNTAPAADTANGSEAEGGEEAPLTTTQSGIPIAPVYAGVLRRRKCFDNGAFFCRK